MPTIQLYGYPFENEEMDGPLHLSEVTFRASPETLRVIAEFLLKSANEIEEQGSKFGYNHLRDTWSGWAQGSGDVIVCSPAS